MFALWVFPANLISFCSNIRFGRQSDKEKRVGLISPTYVILTTRIDEAFTPPRCGSMLQTWVECFSRVSPPRVIGEKAQGNSMNLSLYPPPSPTPTKTKACFNRPPGKKHSRYTAREYFASRLDSTPVLFINRWTFLPVNRIFGGLFTTERHWTRRYWNPTILVLCQSRWKTKQSFG